MRSARMALRLPLAAIVLFTAIAHVADTPTDASIGRVPNPPVSADLPSLPGDLRAILAPEPAGLNDFIADPVMARALGKALFWDMQVGSDGVQACASCHFRAGAD